LIKAVYAGKDIPDHELKYKDMDKEESYDNIFKELRIQSLTKEPQYNIIMWDNNIKTEEEAVAFLKKNNVKYIISKDAITIANRRLEDTKVASLEKEFEPVNKRIYRAVYADVSLFLYKVASLK